VCFSVPFLTDCPRAPAVCTCADRCSCDVASRTLGSVWRSSYSAGKNNRYVGRSGRDSDLLRAGRSGERIPVEVRFSAPVQTGPGAQPPSCTTGTGSLSQDKVAGAYTSTPPPKFHGLLRGAIYVWYGDS
jgi:hypothetical protein